LRPRKFCDVITQKPQGFARLLRFHATLSILNRRRGACELTATRTNGGARSALFGAGLMLELIRDGGAVTRADLVRRTGLSRSTVAHRLEVLIANGLVREDGATASTGGRPPATLAFNPGAGLVLVADLGATHSRLAVTDLAGAVLAEEARALDIAAGPEPVLAAVHERLSALLQQADRIPDDVRGIGVGVPGPVAFSTGQPVNPPLMPGWDGFSIPGWFNQRYDAPVLVDNDVNVMAVGEQRTHWGDCEHLLFVKVATGIGCGISAAHRIRRGALGAAGDIGHVRISGHDDVVCRCGNTGCLEAVAGGRALAERLAAAGREASGSRDVARLVRAGDTLATRLVREAGRCLGEVLASCVNLFNPGAIVIGGALGEAHEPLLAGVREVTIRRSLPLATRHLRIGPSRLGDRAGVVGASMMVREHVLAPDAIERTLDHA
jgi:predicted NBD/HSP70 family sugar kinase